MAMVKEVSSKGRIVRVQDGVAVFRPTGTSYELHLIVTGGGIDGPVDGVVNVVIRAKARKVYTVPSGGNFTSPIQGPPKIVQGWVVEGDERTLVIHAGANFVLELPALDSAIDLGDGAIAVNRMVNAVLMPGATIELVKQTKDLTENSQVREALIP
jgi:hypothetical protein